MHPTLFATKTVQYMRSLGQQLYTAPGEINIVYIEGINPDGSLNSDAVDRFNDLGLLIRFTDGHTPQIIHSALCTTEPGYLATFSPQARALGGVARVQLTQYLQCWQMGYHKGRPEHPALVQCAPMLVHRDRNRDFMRPGDPLMPAWGINHHGTRPGYTAKAVGMFSLGCTVRLNWEEHLEFIAILKRDPRYMADPRFKFTATYLDGSKLLKFDLGQAL